MSKKDTQQQKVSMGLMFRGREIFKPLNTGRIKRKTIPILLLTLCLIMCTGCNDRNFENYRPITDLNNLEGRKIGVGLAWASDYLLSDRDDLILYRYDSTSDMLLALCYKQLDAVAVDYTTAKQILSLTTGLHQVEGALTEDHVMCVCSKDMGELCDLFNQWIAEFKTTERYQAWRERFLAFDGINYEWEGEDLTGTGKQYRIATYADWYPFCYLSQDGNVEGLEVELIRMFANDMNLDVTIVATSEVDLDAGVSSGIYDMVFGNLSELYREDYITEGFCVTDFYNSQPIVVLEIEDQDNLGIADASVLDEN